MEKRPEAVKIVSELKGESHPDPNSIKSAQERLRIWDQEVRWYDMLSELVALVETNPYPGQQLRLLAIAHMLLPTVSRRELREMLLWAGLDPTDRWRMPVDAGSVDLDDLEGELEALLDEHRTVAASVVPQMVKVNANSKEYRTVKQSLMGRGWRWSTKRINGVKTAIVTAPPPPPT